MKTLMELAVGDKVIVHGGHWSAKPFLASVESATPAKVVVDRTTYSRSTGLGPAVKGGRDNFGTSRHRITVASEEEIKSFTDARRKQNYIAKIRAHNLDELPLEALEGILKLMCLAHATPPPTTSTEKSE